MQGEEGPYWLRLAGEERLEKELGALRRDVKAGKLPGVTKVLLPDGDLRCWRVKVEWLDPLTQAGMQFNTQLERVKQEHGLGQASLQLEVCFGEAHPAEPFFLRIVRPRVKPLTVHVTEGGSVCLEALASCGGEHGWNPDRTVSGILQQLLRELVLPPEPRQADSAETTDAAREPRWPRWPLEIELGELAMEGYSLREAQDAFQLAAWKGGWASPPPRAVLAAPAAAKANSRLALPPGLPSGWELSEALLAGQTTYVELPLPGQPRLPNSPCQAAALAESERVLQLWAARPHPSSRVLRIERVQSLDLWRRYTRRRELVEQESGLPDVQLFHGTSREALELICRAGFDVRLANSRGSLGLGLYFGDSSATSAHYCGKVLDRAAVSALGHQPADLKKPSGAPPAGGAGAAPRFQPGGHAMLLCRVAVGKAGSGGPGAKAPQPGCHSAAGYGTMHVVYCSDQAYPEYVIHF